MNKLYIYLSDKFNEKQAFFGELTDFGHKIEIEITKENINC